MSKIPNYLGYIVSDTPYNREWYPALVGRGFVAPVGYADILPYRKIKTVGFEAPLGYKPSEPAPFDPILETVDPSWADDPPSTS